jgi:hypothetical protein
MPKQVAYEPMTFGNMRQFGMTRLDVWCHGYLCEQRAMIDCPATPPELERLSRACVKWPP